MTIFSESRDVKPGAWADGLLDSVALSSGQNDESLNPKKIYMKLNPIDYDETIRFSLIPLIPITVPPDKEPESLNFAVWMFRKTSTERDNKLLFSKKLSEVIDQEKIVISPLSQKDMGLNFYLKVAILEESKKSSFPLFIAGEKVFRVSFEVNEFPTRYCKFSEQGWPKASWYLDITAESPEELLYLDEEPRVIVYINEDIPDLVRLSKSSAARSSETKIAYFLTINFIYYDVAVQLSEWVLNKIPDNELDFPEWETDSIGFIVISALKRLLKCGTFAEVKNKYNDDAPLFKMKLQEALKFHASFNIGAGIT